MFLRMADDWVFCPFFLCPNPFLHLEIVQIMFLLALFEGILHQFVMDQHKVCVILIYDEFMMVYP
jgi:hypothetical protein